MDPKKFVEAHNAIGGPSPTEVKRMIGTRKEQMTSSNAWLSEKKSKLEEAEKKLKHLVKTYATSEKNAQRLKARLG